MLNFLTNYTTAYIRGSIQGLAEMFRVSLKIDFAVMAVGSLRDSYNGRIRHWRHETRHKSKSRLILIRIFVFGPIIFYYIKYVCSYKTGVSLKD